MIDYRYNFPEHENNKDIFGEQNNYNVFIDASGFTYLGTYEEFAKGFPFDNEIAMKIPMGHKAILAYERLNIVSCGNIVWKNQDRNAWTRQTLDGRKINYFDNSVTPVIDRYLDNVYCIYDRQGKSNYGAYCGFIDSYERAMTKAIALSKECNEKFLVCKVLAWQQWH
jgi:hypothetical protein